MEEKIIKLDLKDIKILSFLAVNSRTPLSEISKKVELSREAVDYRIKNYEKRGLVQGYRTIVDISKFGYYNYHLFLNLNSPSSKIEKNIFEKLKKYPFVRAIINFGGRFDLEIAFVSKNLQDLDKIINDILNSCGNYVRDYEILTILKTYIAKTFPNNFAYYKKESKEKIFTKTKFDKIDIEILKIIGESAKESLVNISNKVGLSIDAVSYRIRNLKNSGYILGFVPVIDYKKLGYNFYALLWNISSLNEKKEKELERFLEKDESVLWAVKTLGRFNLLMYVLVKNTKELQETTNKLRSLFPSQINPHEILIAYEEFKYLYFPKGLF